MSICNNNWVFLTFMCLHSQSNMQTWNQTSPTSDKTKFWEFNLRNVYLHRYSRIHLNFHFIPANIYTFYQNIGDRCMCGSRGMFNKFCKKKIKDGFRLEILSQPCNFFSKAHYPFRLSSSNGLNSSNFLFLCNPPLPGGVKLRCHCTGMFLIPTRERGHLGCQIHKKIVA